MKPTTHPIASLLLLFGLLALLSFPLAAAAGVAARLSQPATYVDQPVRLILERDDGEELSPDLSVLNQDFEILGRATQQNISIINGRMSAKHSLVLTLLPKHAGELTIPAIPCGDQTTQALSLKVTAAPEPAAPSREGGPARVELSLDKTSAYPEEQVMLTLKLYQAAGVRGERLDEPRPSLPDAHLQLLNETEYSTEKDGTLYRVLERDYALFAYQAGTLEIGPVGFVGRGGGSALFGLFDDPFGNRMRPPRMVRASSNPVSLKIEPVPTSFTGDRWLPAKNLQLLETGIDKNGPLLAGKPLTRRIMLLADGLTSSQLPPIDTTLPEGIKPYEERPLLHDNPGRTGISGSRQSTVTLMPTQPGHYTLPAIEIPWWNTETDRQEMARLPAVELDILPNPAASAVDTSPQPAQSDATQEHAPQTAPATEGPKGPAVPWLVWLLAGAWLATLLAWWFTHRRGAEHRRRPTQGETTLPASERRQAMDEVVAAMGHAYACGDAEAARERWLEWARLTWPERPPNNLARLAERLDPGPAQAVIALEKALYGPGRESDWHRFDPQRINDPRPAGQAPEREERLLPLNP